MSGRRDQTLYECRDLRLQSWTRCNRVPTHDRRAQCRKRIAECLQSAAPTLWPGHRGCNGDNFLLELAGPDHPVDAVLQYTRQTESVLGRPNKDGVTRCQRQPPLRHGFLSVAMAWQIAFLVIGSNPARFRPLMIPRPFREARSRRRSGSAVWTWAPLGRRRDGGRARPSAGRSLSRGLRDDTQVHTGRVILTASCAIDDHRSAAMSSPGFERPRSERPDPSTYGHAHISRKPSSKSPRLYGRRSKIAGS
jgi:hypothetical protein